MGNIHNNNLIAGDRLAPVYTTVELTGLVQKNRVHRDVYLDPAIFDLEMERIWARAWVYVGHASQVPDPGDYIGTSIGKEPVLMVRDKRARVNVIYNRCGHKGAKVATKPGGNTAMFRCPYHGWTFNLDGTLNATPHKCGYEDTDFDTSDPQFSMQPVARVESHRGFVFASLAAEGEDLKTFMGATLETIDNMADRSPEGEVEVAGACLPYLHDCNWKMFVENLNDAQHPMVCHASVGFATRALMKRLPAGAEPPKEAEIISPFGASYQFFDDLGVSVMPNGHSFMGGQQSIHSAYSDIPGYLDSMIAAHGRERTEQVLGSNRHNTTIYPSFTIKDAVQIVRVVRPLAVDKTLIQTWHFRLKGAPEAMLHRTMTYSRLINSPASMVGPDDFDCYNRMQESLCSNSAQWVDMRRYIGREETLGPITRAKGTSDLSMRNQYRAWLHYMAGSEAQETQR
ncbi:Rieske 2Fe-2S domain-containing protein [Exilibacterium tricleocarpae]|uniref:Rieske 2Fe-2S domain-containing protein n=2 Tax=Exilibacterium tricleocarpae TaxID=2591008 RepID=A0A545TP44_9GAMM|nr:Rieske 2Fe-2S domain-containing protein [Exilibacterium tricleocarpae]